MRAATLLCFALLFSTTFAFAQTGKIAGVVTEASTGDPLPGVNVVIEGTTQGATTDIDGFYNILNVSPGTYDLRASFVGYASSVVEGVEVDIDLTTEVDIQLQEEALGLDELVVTAEAPIIQKDIAASQRNINAEEIQAAPFKSISNLMTAQVGVNDVSVFVDRPQIRGSNFDESLFIVDGVSQNDALTNRPHYNVNVDAVEEVKLQTGGFSAEYGNVRSGVISVVTKEGGEAYSGSVNFQYSPPGLKHFGPDLFGFESPVVQPFVDPEAGAFEGNEFFEGWRALVHNEGQAGSFYLPEDAPEAEVDRAATLLYARYLWRHRSQDAIDELERLADQGLVTFPEGVDPNDYVFQQSGVVPDYRASATFGGPVPFLNPVRFFLSYDRYVSEYAYRFPERAYNDQNLRGKLTTSLGQGMKLNFHGFYSTQRGGSGGGGPGFGGFISTNPFTSTGAENKYWYPHCAVPGIQTRQIYGAQWTHTLSSNTFYEIDFTHDRTDYKLDMVLRDTAPIPGSGGTDGTPIPSSSGTSGSGINAGAIGTTAEAEALAAAGQEGWENWRDWARIQIGDVWFDEAPYGFGPVNWRDITGEYRMESCRLRNNNSYSRGLELTGSITSQVNRYNQVKAGFQIRRDLIDMSYSGLDPSVNAGDIIDSRVDPWRGSLYAQDKLEFKGFVANLGLRLDGMVTGAFPAVLEGCDVGSGVLDCGDDGSGPYSEFLQAGQTTEFVEGGRVLGEREVSIDEALGSERHTHFYLSPRVGISHPITTVAKIFFNYGHFYQWPDATQMYQVELLTARGFRANTFGNPLLKPERTIQYEVGYEHNLFNKMNLRLTGYYKDINNEIDDIDVRPFGFGGASYETFANMEYRDVRGLEAFLELRQGVVPFISGWVSGNYLAESGAEYGYEEFFEDPVQQPELGNLEPSNPDVRPIVKANLTVATPDDFWGPKLGDISLLGGISASLLYTWQRGENITWNPRNIPLVEDNLRWEPYVRADLRINKSLFAARGIESVFYIDVSNLFNNRVMTRFRSLNDATIGDENWAWSGHRWWKNQEREYLYSLGYTPDNQQDDGSFVNTIGNPGDYDDERIDLPGFTPWTFLGKRDIFFGFKFYF